jgi:hypothetical protein
LRPMPCPVKAVSIKCCTCMLPEWEARASGWLGAQCAVCRVGLSRSPRPCSCTWMCGRPCGHPYGMHLHACRPRHACRCSSVALHRVTPPAWRGGRVPPGVARQAWQQALRRHRWPPVAGGGCGGCCRAGVLQVLGGAAWDRARVPGWRCSHAGPQASAHAQLCVPCISLAFKLPTLQFILLSRSCPWPANAAAGCTGR